MSTNINSLFADAQDDGMSAAAAGILVNNLSGATMAGAQGVNVDDLAGDEVTLFVRVLDRSSSMGRFTQVVIDASNEQVAALKKSKAADSILMSTWIFNQRSSLLHSYLPLDQVPMLDSNSYDPDGTTLLYDSTLDAITSAVAYAQTLRSSGIRVKVVVVVVSDGEDNESRHTVANVKTVVDDLIAQEIYIVSMVFFGYNGRDVARQMGVPDGNVLDEKADPSAIRHGMGQVSASVIRASQTVIGTNQSGSFFS